MISIIIPVYNTEQYLSQCLKSILNSSCKDFEVILVNDGSTDHSLSICRRYSRKDSRIRVFDQEHRGVSEARNRGINESKGEWIVFVDADDMISHDFLQKIARKEYSDRDFLLFDYLKLAGKSRGKTIAAMEAMPKERCDRFRELYFGREDRNSLIRKLLDMSQIEDGGCTSLLSPWAKAYKRTVIERYSIRFHSDLEIGEDRLFNLEYLRRMESCVYFMEAVYYVRIHRDSTMLRFHFNYLQNDYRYQENLRALLKESDILPVVKKAYYNSVLTNMADVLVRGIFNPYSSRHYRENLKLCHEMQRFEIYRRALKYNGKTGIIPRRIMLFFFQKKCYHIVNLICKCSYFRLWYQ